jgi:hypothetical protein
VLDIFAILSSPHLGCSIKHFTLIKAENTTYYMREIIVCVANYCQQHIAAGVESNHTTARQLGLL